MSSPNRPSGISWNFGRLRLYVVLIFLVIAGSILYVGYQSRLSRENTEILFLLRIEAETFTRLSKDLLISENLIQSFDRWQIARERFVANTTSVLSNDAIINSLNSDAGRQELAWTQKFLEILIPRLQAIETNINTITNKSSLFIPGLYAAQAQYPQVDMGPAIVEIRNFSLYVADLLAARVQGLYDSVRYAGMVANDLALLALFGLSLISFFFILGMIGALKGAQDTLKTANINLEGLLSAIFELSGQGFLVFNQSLRCDLELSSQATKILGYNPGGKFVIDVLPFDGPARRDFPDAIDIVFKGEVDPSVIFGLFSQEYEINNKHIRLNWRLLPNKTVLVVLNDITREHALKVLMAREEARKTLILKAVGHRRYFADFHHDALGLFAMSPSKDDPESINDLVRHIHTFKGNAMFFSFDTTAKLAQDLEYLVGDALVLGQEVDYKLHLEQLQGAFNQEFAILTEFLGTDWVSSLDSVMVPRHHYQTLERYVRKHHAEDTRLQKALLTHRSLPIKDMFARFPALVESLATRLGKTVAPVIVQGGGFLVVPELWEPLVSSLVHIARNMVDHGIELQSDRERAGKPIEGKINVELSSTETHIRIIMADDGAGIDIDRVQEAAKAKGIIPESWNGSQDDIYQLLFAQGVSTAAATTDVSGFGVGLSAVKAEVNAIGGTIKVQSAPGIGTAFIIEIAKQKGVV